MQEYGEIFSKVYNKDWKEFSEYISPLIYNFIELKRDENSLNKSLLDLCCGTGQLAKFFLKKGYKIYGVDKSPHMLRYAKDNNKMFEEDERAVFIKSDALSFELPEKISFVVSVFDSLNHLPDIDSLKTCFSRVYDYLTDNGIFIFDLNTTKGLYGFNDFSIQDDEDMTIIRNGFFAEELNRAYVRIYGYVKNNRGNYVRFEENMFNQAFDMDEVEGLLNQVGFDEIYPTVIESLELSVDEPESEERIFFIAKK